MNEQKADAVLHPETHMMGYAYRPDWSEGAVKCPIFQTSTYVFPSAESGKAFFEVAYGLRPEAAGEASGLIYSRLNHPNQEILEARLALWDRAEACAAFESGMAAIATTLLSILRAGDVILHSEPLYGGTDHLIRELLPGIGIQHVAFPAEATEAQLEEAMEAARRLGTPALIYVETPSNPTNALTDVALCAALARRHAALDRPIRVAVDNTFLGPLWQHPLAHGADLVLYSATKYIGGHSDVIAGAALGARAVIEPVKAMRTFLGTGASPWTCWLLLRSLESLKVRMERQMQTARRLVAFLDDHPAVSRVDYPGHDAASARDREIFQRQCEGAGAMISFAIKGGEAEAFRVLNALELIKLAVSLGGTESLAEHPATMTHAAMPSPMKDRLGITPSLIRLSVGLEHPDDLIAELERALATMTT